jgi:hypothetical protein
MDQKTLKLLPTRRDLLKSAGLAFAGSMLGGTVGSLQVHGQGKKVNPRATARNVIYLELGGCVSQADTFDYKEQWNQPKDLDVVKVRSDLYLSKTLFPNLIKHMDTLSIVRSLKATELVHFNGEYHTQTGRGLNPALAKEIPAFGSVIAYELESQRRPTDTFPTYITTYRTTGYAGVIGPGFLPPQFAALDLNPLTVFDTFGGAKEGVDPLLEERWNQLGLLSESENPMGIGNKATEISAYYDSAHRILTDPRWNKVFKLSEEDKKRYDDDEVGRGFILARNLLAADAGTRMVYVYDASPWDQHSRLFDRAKQQNHYVNCARLDRCLSSLLVDLAKLPGHTPGKSLLDETIIVAKSEFGRTPTINLTAGRDHWAFVYSGLFAGGGVKGGRIIGSTDFQAGHVADTGWKHKEQPAQDNVVATIYSALGIDWTKRIENTPSKRAYEYVQAAPVGGTDFISNDAIDELFA